MNQYSLHEPVLWTSSFQLRGHFSIDWFWDLIFRTNWDVRDVDKLSVGNAQSWYKVRTYDLVNPNFKISLFLQIGSVFLTFQTFVPPPNPKHKFCCTPSSSFDPWAKKTTPSISGAMWRHLGTIGRAWPRWSAQVSGFILVKCQSSSAHYFFCSWDFTWLSAAPKHFRSAWTACTAALARGPSDGLSARSVWPLYMPTSMTRSPGCYKCCVPIQSSLLRPTIDSPQMSPKNFS